VFPVSNARACAKSSVHVIVSFLVAVCLPQQRLPPPDGLDPKLLGTPPVPAIRVTSE